MSAEESDHQAWTIFRRVEMEAVSTLLMEHAASRNAGRMALVMYLLLLTWGGKNHIAYPSADTLAMALLTKRDITQAMKLLETAELISVSREWCRKGGSKVRYLVRGTMDFNPRVLPDSSTFPTAARLTENGKSGTTENGSSGTTENGKSPLLMTEGDILEGDSRFFGKEADVAPLKLVPDEPSDLARLWSHWLEVHQAYRATEGKRVSSPKMSTHKAVMVAALKKHSVEDLKAVTTWAHKALGFHPEHLRKGNYLTPGHLFVAKLIGVKISKALDWKTDGDPAEAAPRGTYTPDTYATSATSDAGEW